MTIRPKNYIAIVLDRSGSMSGIRQETVDAFNAQVSRIKEESQDQDTTVSFFTFANNVETKFYNVPLGSLQPIKYKEYDPNGMTALLDGVGTCIDMFRSIKDANDPNVSFLVITITDGDENHSSRYSDRKESGKINVVELIDETQRTDRWSFAFLMPPGQGKKFAQKYNIPTDNIREWDATKQGVAVASQATNSGLTNYFEARRTGQTNVAAFYHTTDLSKIDRSTVHAKLTDLSRYLKVYEVPTESRIDEFVSSKTKQPYIVGSGYYQLMKKETIQTHKKVLIMEKGQKQIWGGDEARNLIGLPTGAESKVTPGNHSNYDIFVQSKAPNRKLPRGTKVIYDPTLTKESDVTWDYKTAYEEAERKRSQLGHVTT